MISYFSNSGYDFFVLSWKIVPGITDVDIEFLGCLVVTVSPIVDGTVDFGFAVTTGDDDELSIVAEDDLADKKDIDDDAVVVFVVVVVIDVPCDENFIVGKIVLFDLFDGIMVLDGNVRTEDENFTDESIRGIEADIVLGIKTLDVGVVGIVTVFATAKTLTQNSCGMCCV